MYQFSCDYSCTIKNHTCALGDFIGLYMYLKGDVVHWLFTCVDLRHTKTLIVKGVMQPQAVVSQ